MISIEEVREIFTRKGHSNIYTRKIINDFLDFVEKQQQLLLLYQNIWKMPIFSQTLSFDEIQDKIDTLEKELGELK